MEFLDLIGGWNRQRDPHRLVLTRLDGSCRVVVRERVRPIPVLTGDVISFATLEGELASAATVACDGSVITTALVEGDDFAAVLESESSPDHQGDAREIVLELARHYPLGLGNPRRRRFRFAPPSWMATAATERAIYRNPDSAQITVHWAIPRSSTLPAALHRSLWLDQTHRTLKDTPTRPVPFVASSGLAGELVRLAGQGLDGRPYSIARGELGDDQYQYIVSLENLVSETDLATLVAVLDSIEPVPRPALTDVASRLLFWTE